MHKKRLLICIGLGAIGISLFYAAAIVALTVRPPSHLEEWFRPKPCKPFSKTLWDSTRFGDPDRYKMANDLVRSGKILGMAEPEAHAMLGPTSSEDHIETEIWLGYDLVPQRQFPAKCWLLPSYLFFNTDTWLLEIRLERGKVKAARIRST